MTRPAPNHRLRARGVLCVLAVTTLVLAGCGDDDDASGTTSTSATPTTATPTTTSPPAPTTAAPTTGVPSTAAPTTASSGPAAGCAGSPAATPPAGAASGTVADVDGDGRADTAWAASDPGGGRSIGIVTAAGGGSSVEIDSASPVRLSVLVANADETGPVEVFVDDNRTTSLFAFVDCTIQPVLNPQGEQYLFDRGFRGNGTGVGCVDADGDGRRDLVGLRAGEPDGDTVPWTRTIIELDGLRASNGPSDSGTYTEPDDAAAIELLHTVSCGDLTLTADGVQQPE